MLRLGREAVLVLASTVLVSCAHGPLSLEPRPDIVADDYAEVLDEWTRTARVYDLVVTRVFLDATFHSPAFRRAFILRHTDVYGPGAEEVQRLTLSKPEYEEHLEFFISVYTPVRRNNDFDKEDSIWRVTLDSDGGPPVLGAVHAVRPTANIRVVYPYITPFTKTYVVRFPRVTAEGAPILTDRTERLRLRIVSALGEADLEWRLVPREAASPQG